MYIKSDYSGGTYFEPAKDYVVEKQRIDNQTEKVIIKWKDGRVWEKVVKGIIATTQSIVLKKRNEILLMIDKGERYDTYIYDLSGKLKFVLKGYGTPSGKSQDGVPYNLKIKLNGIQTIKLERRPIGK